MTGVQTCALPICFLSIVSILHTDLSSLLAHVVLMFNIVALKAWIDMGSKFIVHLACVVTCARVLLGIIIANGTKKVWIAYVSCIYSNNCFPIFLKVDSMGRSLFCKLLFDYLDEDEIIKEVVMGSTSQRKRHRYIRRNHLAGNERLFLDYFAPSPVLPPILCRIRFQMRFFFFNLR